MKLSNQVALVTSGAQGIGRVIALTLALEYGDHGITVNAICPAPVEGERMRTVIAQLVLYLCSSAGDRITGQAIDVDAGYLLK